MHQLTRHLAKRLAPLVTVNAIAPGPFESKMMAATLEAFGEQIAVQRPAEAHRPARRHGWSRHLPVLPGRGLPDRRHHPGGRGNRHHPLSRTSSARVRCTSTTTRGYTHRVSAPPGPPVAGAKEDAFDDAFRDEYLPALAKSDGSRLLWYLRLSHGSGQAYTVVSITGCRDAAAWAELAERVRGGDLAEWSAKVDAMRHSTRPRWSSRCPGRRCRTSTSPACP